MGPKPESRKAANLAYIEYEGPYGDIPWQNIVKRLYDWAKGQKVMPGFYPMATYHNDPETVSYTHLTLPTILRV